MLPTTVFDALVAHGGNVLIDIRTPEEKEAEGVPDLPNPSERPCLPLPARPISAGRLPGGGGTSSRGALCAPALEYTGSGQSRHHTAASFQHCWLMCATVLPSAGKGLELALVRVGDGRLEERLRDASSVEAESTAIQIAALKQLSRGLTVYLLDSRGGTARAGALGPGWPGRGCVAPRLSVPLLVQPRPAWQAGPPDRSCPSPPAPRPGCSGARADQARLAPRVCGGRRLPVLDRRQAAHQALARGGPADGALGAQGRAGAAGCGCLRPQNPRTNLFTIPQSDDTPLPFRFIRADGRRPQALRSVHCAFHSLAGLHSTARVPSFHAVIQPLPQHTRQTRWCPPLSWASLPSSTPCPCWRPCAPHQAGGAAGGAT